MVAGAANDANPQDFLAILNLARSDEDYCLEAEIPAVAALPAWGKHGIEELKKIVISGPHDRAAFSVLLSIAIGQRPSSKDYAFLRETWDELCVYDVPHALAKEARRILQELVLEQMDDFYLSYRIFSGLNDIMLQSAFATKGDAESLRKGDPKQVEKVSYFFRSLLDPRLNLNEGLIKEFSEFLDADPEKEKELHEFLFKHPVFLDPLAIEIRSKHELGEDFQTDFVVKRINNEYVLVEIEKSTDKIFTEKGGFHSDLTDSIRQVRDFQSWISDHIEYARSKLPMIRRPEGLLVIGRRRDWSPQMIRSLEEENFSRRGHIKIVTYDDLLEQAKVIYKNMLEKPLRVKGKKEVAPDA
ncbi:MAG: DUF4263 domain-containing protein [Acidobacteriota bacterium]|nr:DUF4263 domain-containing protein [Acidobacteriota bacterium]